MQTILHVSATRGHANYGWLDTRYTFSFANYYNPERVRFGMLRVINDDRIEGGGGFDLHPHDNMEIVTIVLDGQLEHRDTIGNTMVIKQNEVQVMSAGTGIQHAEYNKDQTIPVHILQIWVFPAVRNIVPRYGQRSFNPDRMSNRWQVLVSPDEQGALRINQKATFSRMLLSAEGSASYTMKSAHHGAYLFLIGGVIEIAGHTLGARDGLGITGAGSFSMNATETSDILVIETPMA